MALCQLECSLSLSLSLSTPPPPAAKARTTGLADFDYPCQGFPWLQILLTEVRGRQPIKCCCQPHFESRPTYFDLFRRWKIYSLISELFTVLSTMNELKVHQNKKWMVRETYDTCKVLASPAKTFGCLNKCTDNNAPANTNMFLSLGKRMARDFHTPPPPHSCGHSAVGCCQLLGGNIVWHALVDKQETTTLV